MNQAIYRYSAHVAAMAMKTFVGLIGFVLITASGLASADTLDFSRNAGENDLAFAARVLQFSTDADPHTIATTWNGISTLFVDYTTTDNYPERPLVALQQQPNGRYRAIRVTLGEQEGGTPDIVAIGFARASRSPTKDLVVILAWTQRHYDFGGTLYEVRIFDTPKPDQTALTLLKISEHFGSECDCGWRDGTTKHFRFKTIAAVKTELKRLGY